MRFRRAVWLAICLAILALAGPAAGARAAFTVDVPAGKLKTVRIRNLPEGATVAIAVQSDGEISVAFVEADELKKKPGGRVRPLFTGRVERRLSFSVQIPATGHYYVLLDNRRGDAARSVTVRIGAARPGLKEFPRDQRPSL